MPIIKSAKKRVKVARKASIRNSKTRRSLKSAMKTFSAKVNSDSHKKAQSALDIAVKKGVMHKNKAARKKKQLAFAAKKAGVKPTASKKLASKPDSKKVVTKKPAAKKPIAKKTTKK